MKIAVLGAGGVFGQNFAQMAKDNGHDVLGIGRSPRKPAPYSLETDFEYIKLHAVEELSELSRVIATWLPDTLVNFAAQAGLVPQSWTYAIEFFETNTMLPIKLEWLLRKHTRLIHIGSSEVYGSVTAPASEDAPIRPSSPYAVSKAAADLHLMTLHDERITVIRPSNCYAEGQALYRLIPRAVHACVTGNKMTINGSHIQKSYMHADDLSRAILLLAENQIPGLFNCGPQSPITISEVVNLVARQFGLYEPDIANYGEGRANEDACFWLSSERLLRLGWKPEVSLDEGIQRMAQWGRKYPQIKTMSTEYEFRP